MNWLIILLTDHFYVHVASKRVVNYRNKINNNLTLIKINLSY